MNKLLTTSNQRYWHTEASVRDEWVRRAAAKFPAGSRVLDAGAGSSKYRPFFSHCRYETQDFCQYEGTLVEYLQPIDHVCDIENIPLPDACMDAIVCTEVIEHVVDPPRVLKELGRLLKPGGTLLLTSPMISHLHMEPYHYFGGFTHYWYRHWLPKLGYEIESITPVGGPGRSCATFILAFYQQWSATEKKTGGWRRVVSWPFRMIARVFALYLMPRLLPQFDGWLGNDVICSGYMVIATRAKA
ncbi:MAG TPA: class I SAM-dependent methyltransferase [Verrucomicrobiae bacterium]|nr:class I SAM-dependent methyltransferase [Verrucomicrobiae bacterium]